MIRFCQRSCGTFIMKKRTVHDTDAPETGIVRQFEEILRDENLSRDELRERYSQLCAQYRLLSQKSEHISEENRIIGEKLKAAGSIITDQQKRIELADKALTDQTEQILVQQAELIRRNEILENEIALARRIQEQLFPSDSYESVAMIYKPMEAVGGDFFDIVRFRDPDKMGLFISDVSGHGVSAAFITAMVKSIILQSGQNKEDPAKLLLYLNDLLIDLSGGNFVTVFYGVYSASSRSLVYANAGHNPPYLINGGQIRPLDEVKRPPLAIASNARLFETDKLYRNASITLPQESKLVLFTDGLTETINPSDMHKMFEDHGLTEEMIRASALPCRDFVRSIYQALTRFRGSESFDDDVCIICLDA